MPGTKQSINKVSSRPSPHVPFGSAQGTANTKVAAYIGQECRGVGELVYVPELGRYMISMFVLGSEVPLSRTTYAKN